MKCPLGRFHRSALITQQLCQLQHGSFPLPSGARPNQEAQKLGWSCCSGPLVHRDVSQLQVNHQEHLLISLHNRIERSFTGRKGQEARVALRFQGSKNNMGAWIPMAVDGERWWRAQQHTSTGQNYSWAADWSLCCRRLTPTQIAAEPPRRKRFPSSGNLKLVLEPHKLSPERPLVSLIYLNFVSKAAFKSLLGFGLLSVNF